jgi:predicted transcriptional regulator
MSTNDIKREARLLVESLPEDATWDELMYRIYVRQAIEAGIEDISAGRIVDVREVRRRFELTE